MIIFRKLFKVLVAIVSYLWEFFWKLPWQGKAVVILVILILCNAQEALPAIIVIIVAGMVIRYMASALVKNAKF